MAALHNKETAMTSNRNTSLANDANISKIAPATKTGEIMAMPLRAKRWIPKTVVTPDYTNQLDLFSEAPIDTPAPIENTPPRIPGGAHARPRPPQQLGFEALEPRPTKTLCSLLSIDSRLPKMAVD
jgi:hypothetical protein